MKYSGPQLPLFNRVVVLVLSSGLLIGIAAGLAGLLTGHVKRDGLDFVTGFLFLVFAGGACFGIWVSLTWRNRTPEELAREAEEQAAFPVSGAPTIPDDALVCRFATRTRAASLAVDFGAAVIHFENCYVPLRFLATTATWYSCPVGDVKAVFSFGRSLTILTGTGKALIPGTATHYAQLREYLAEAVPTNPPGFAAEHPLMPFVYLAGACFGLFGGAILAPRNADGSTLGLFVLLGAFGGVFASRLLVYLADRLFHLNLARPIGGGMIGAIGGLLISKVLAPAIAWNMTPIVFLVLTGALIGCFIGVKRPPRRT